MIDTIGFLVITLILFWIFNGLTVKWNLLHLPTKPLEDVELEKLRQRDIKLWSKWWHRVALVIRVCLWLSIWMITLNWILTLIIIVIDCIGYPITINLINGLKWNFIGTTAKTDILITKTITLIKKIIVWLKVKIKLK